MFKNDNDSQQKRSIRLSKDQESARLAPFRIKASQLEVSEVFLTHFPVDKSSKTTICKFYYVLTINF